MQGHWEFTIFKLKLHLHYLQSRWNGTPPPKKAEEASGEREQSKKLDEKEARLWSEKCKIDAEKRRGVEYLKVAGMLPVEIMPGSEAVCPHTSLLLQTHSHRDHDKPLQSLRLWQVSRWQSCQQVLRVSLLSHAWRMLSVFFRNCF